MDRTRAVAAGVEIPRRSPRRALVALCITQVTSWGVLYYAFPVALAPITADPAWPATPPPGAPPPRPAASAPAPIVPALAGIPVGGWLARHGPRRVMTAGWALAVPAAIG